MFGKSNAELLSKNRSFSQHHHNKKIKIYNASTGECFGSSKKSFDENSSFSPNSPYALSKIVNSYLAKNYRDNLGMWVVNGFSFNHDSPLQTNNYILNMWELETSLERTSKSG